MREQATILGGLVVLPGALVFLLQQGNPLILRNSLNSHDGAGLGKSAPRPAAVSCACNLHAWGVRGCVALRMLLISMAIVPVRRGYCLDWG